MKCGFDGELLNMYADGALKRERVAHAETHVSQCDECRGELVVMRDIGNALNSVPREGAPRALVERILADAEGNVHRTGWDCVRWTVIAVWTASVHGFRIEDDRERLLRREVPEWVARWVLFV